MSKKDKRIKGCPDPDCARHVEHYKYKTSDRFCTLCGSQLVYVCAKCFDVIEDSEDKRRYCENCKPKKQKDGTEEQKQMYVPGVAAGEQFVAFGLTEPGAGSDAGSLKTKAVKDGDDYILNGRKCFITMAPFADYSVIFAKTSPEKGTRGITAFMVDMKLPGVSCGKPEEKMGQRGVRVSDIILEDVRVPASCIIGEVDKGFTNAMKTLNVGRIGVASMSIGMASEALDIAVEYTKNREQFGKPLAAQQALRFMMADMQTRLNAAKLLVYDAAYRMDIGDPDATAAASMAKYYAAENAQWIIDRALQLHGGYGYSREYAIERLYRDIRICSIYEGSSQVQQIVIAGNLLK